MSASKQARLEARISPENHAIIQHAASLSGLSLTDFVISASLKAAEDAIARHDIIQLSLEQSEQFARALQNPPPPNQALKKAARNYQKRVVRADASIPH